MKMLKQRIMKFRRDRWRDIVIRLGKQQRLYERALGSIDPELWPIDAEYLEGRAEFYRKRKERYLTLIKETA